MKPTQVNYSVLLLTLLASFGSNIIAGPIGTAFTYQGRLASGTNAANGLYDFSFAVFDDASVGTQKGLTLTTSGVTVTNGLFTATLDFGSVFDGNARWLAVWVKTNAAGSYTALTPRQPLMPTPYAVFASSLSSNVNQTFTGTVTFAPSSGPPFTVGSSAKVLNLNADLLDGLDSTAFWQLGGNAGTTAGVNFLGTVDNQPLEMKSFGQRVLRLEATSGAPNFVAGSSNNYVGSGYMGGAIGGGATNVIGSSFGTIGGGSGNTVRYASDYGAIGGGTGNLIAGESANSTIGGGSGNVVYFGNGTIGGGQGNVIDYGLSATIAGGQGNWVGDSMMAHYAAIGGGRSNLVAGGSYDTIAGGFSNRVEAAALATSGGTISGGRFNSLAGDGSTISGGQSNVVSSTFSSIGGGFANTIGTNADNSTIAGGGLNEVRLGKYSYGYATTNSSIGGGYGNHVYVTDSVIGGGISNWVGNVNSGTRGFETGHTISGGEGNVINYDNTYSTISGGFNNGVDGSTAVICGGAGNQIRWAGPSYGNSIGGGQGNSIQSLGYCFIGGGLSNQVSGLGYGCVPGGRDNVALYYGFAAGRRAKAINQGAFVWADSTDEDFASAANDQFLIRATGGVGVGATNPVVQLDVRGKASFGNAFMPTASNASNVMNLQVGLSTNGWQNGITFCEDTNGTGMKLGYDGVGMGATNKLLIYDIDNVPRFVFESGGNLGLGVYEPGSPIQHSSGARLTAGGVWQNASDANRKTDFREVNPQEVLATLARLPVQSWRYTNELSGVRHLGPTAQDFKAAFSLGTDDKSIGTVDADGVALAAIQGLNQVLKEKDARIQSLEKDMAELKAMINTLVQKADGGGQ